MAIYSGFSNRQLEDRYNQLLKKLINLLNQIIITHVQQTKIESFFKDSYLDIYQRLHQLQTRKYTHPKFSEFMAPLNQHLNLSESIITEAFSQRPRKRPQTGNLIGGASLNLKNSNQHHPNSSSYRYNNRTLRIPKKSQQKIQSINYINQTFIPQSAEKRQRVKRRYSSYSVDQKNNKEKLYQQQLGQLSMQQIMQKHPIIDRKLSQFRKKVLQKSKFPKIQEQDCQQQILM